MWEKMENLVYDFTTSFHILALDFVVMHEIELQVWEGKKVFLFCKAVSLDWRGKMKSFWSDF